ncbi:MAG: hypothetical protein BWX87_00869 [Bacteroidetes bacterium ADurb.Bin123]|nr:MAG: hypothetical protein BWX87_00869 [Bacteroidetes bacterium ADurb.Bin123]
MVQVKLQSVVVFHPFEIPEGDVQIGVEQGYGIFGGETSCRKPEPLFQVIDRIGCRGVGRQEKEDVPLSEFLFGEGDQGGNFPVEAEVEVLHLHGSRTKVSVFIIHGREEEGDQVGEPVGADLFLTDQFLGEFPDKGVGKGGGFQRGVVAGVFYQGSHGMGKGIPAGAVTGFLWTIVFGAFPVVRC